MRTDSAAEGSYERKFVFVFRGREAHAVTKHRSEGWELESQNRGRLRTELTFCRIRPIEERHRKMLWIGSVLVLTMAIIGAAVVLGPSLTDPPVPRVASPGLDADPDGDGLSNGLEMTGWATRDGEVFRTDPNLADSDGDGLDDGVEAGVLVPTTTGSTVYGGLSDPTEWDGDGDGLDDASELDGGFDAWSADSDDDGADDFVEIEYGSDPLVADADGDEVSDRDEIAAGSDTYRYDLSYDATFRAFVLGATYDFGRLTTQQKASLPYLAGKVLKGAVALATVRQLTSKFGAARDVVSALNTRAWDQALRSLVDLAPGVDTAKAGASAVAYARQDPAVALAAMQFVAALPMPEDVRLNALHSIAASDEDSMRVTSDVLAEASNAPAPLLTSRPVSLDPATNDLKDELVANLESQGYSDLRVNQQQVDAEGAVVGINRPDVQATAPDGIRYYWEVAPDGSGSAAVLRVLSNDDAGVFAVYSGT